MHRSQADRVDGAVAGSWVVLVAALAYLSDLGGTDLLAYVGVAAVGVGLAAVFVRSWIREWRRAGELAERVDRIGTEK